jgi:7,8-dihydropterin-6-yl-methyl-4-(beta-D-ribofuranosyl)aminobenzene 5'-phosphate synthase
MRVSVLVENSVLEDEHDVRAEFGLSLHVAHQGHQLLFDTGTSGVFADNAEAMGIAVHEVEAAVLSHHHFDHGGGLERFFEINQQAPLYLRESGGGQPQFRAFGVIKRPVGVDWEVLQRHRDRLKYASESAEILPGIFLLTKIPDLHERPRGNRHLFVEKDGAATRDPFDHELMMVIHEEDGMVVFTGCSHRGVLNMIDAAIEHFPGVPIKAVLGGFHLIGLPFLNSMAGSREEIEEIARQIAARVSGTVYTGHCTGDKAFGVLRGVMGESLQPMPTGANIEI